MTFYCIWLDRSEDVFFRIRYINTLLVHTHTHINLTTTSSPCCNFVQVLWILCCWPSPGLGDLLSKWLPTCAVGAPRGHRAVHPWAGVATGSQRWGGLQASAQQVQGQDLMMILETSNSIVFEVVWLDKSTGVKQVLGDISLPNHEVLPNCFGCRWLQPYVQPFWLLHRRKDQRRHANRRRKRIPRAWRSCPRFQTCVSRIFRATPVMNLLLQVLLFPRGTRDQGAAPARGWNGKCSSVLQDTLDIQRQETGDISATIIV